MKYPKHIANTNIPEPLSLKENPAFNICNITNDGHTNTLDYILEDKGLSIYMDDFQSFEELPSKIKILSGGWYGDKGRWSPLVRYVGKIVCENTSIIKKISDSGEDYKFKVRKAFFSDYKIIAIESKSVGKVKIKCKTIVPQEYDTFLFNILENKWVPRNSISLK